MPELIDPRPMEPAWVRETEPSNLIEFRIVRYSWNKEQRTYDKQEEIHSAKLAGFLDTVASMLRAGIECTIEADASQHVPAAPGTQPIHYGIKVPGFTCMFSRVRWLDRETPFESIYDEEETTDNDEVLASVEWLCNECKVFSVDISSYDPTP